MRLAPSVFWAMSLKEWRACIAGNFPHRAAPLARAGLEALMKDFPDG